MIWLVSGIIDLFVLLVILLLIAFSCFALWDTHHVVQEAAAARYQVYKPVEEEHNASFEELRAINPEVFSWITIYGTNIDYPVVQGPDNMEYVSTDVEGRYSLTGSIFLDSRQNRDFSSFPNILYGHHMEKKAMFGEIGSFTDKPYFDARRYGALFYDGKHHGLEIMALIHADAYDNSIYQANIQGQEGREAYIKHLMSKVLHNRGPALTPNDRIILLSTCSDIATNGRDILVAKIVDHLYENPFKDEPKVEHTNPVVDELVGWWVQAPFLAKAILLGVAVFLVLWLLLALVKRDRRYYQIIGRHVRC